jgi:hypothetical protein
VCHRNKKGFPGNFAAIRLDEILHPRLHPTDNSPSALLKNGYFFPN